MVLHLNRTSHTAMLPALAALLMAAQTGGRDSKTDREGMVQDGEKRPAPRNEPVLVKLANVLGTEVVNGKQEKLGRIEELVVDPQGGRIREAVLALAGAHHDKRVAVRWEALTWDAMTRRCSHETTREQLERAPAWRSDALDGALRKDPTAGTGGQPAEKDDADPESAGSGKKKMTPPLEAAMARVDGAPKLVTRLAALRVAAGADDLGTPSDVYTELRTGSLAFVTLSLGDVLGIGGKTYVVPWSALTLQTGSDEKSLLKIATMDRKQLEAAPRLESRDDILNPTFRGRLYQFFGVRLPEYEPDHDLLGKVEKRGGQAAEKR